MNDCLFQPIEGGGWRCQRCHTPTKYRGAVAPKRPCGNPPEKRTAPCVYQGEDAGKVGCQTCAGNVQIKTFACLSADVPQPRAAWSEKTLPADVAKCGGCRFYEPRKGKPTPPPES